MTTIVVIVIVIVLPNNGNGTNNGNKNNSSNNDNTSNFSMAPGDWVQGWLARSLSWLGRSGFSQIMPPITCPGASGGPRDI